MVNCSPEPTTTEGLTDMPTTTDLTGLVEDAARLHHQVPGDVLTRRRVGPGRPTSALRVVLAALRANGFSLPAIGTMTGHHHTTVLWHLRRLTATEQTQAEQLAVKYARRAAA